jgi:Spy/CpxP family protein refolding chaperone
MARHCAWVVLLVMVLAAVSPAEAEARCELQRPENNVEPKQKADSRRDDPPRWKWWLHPESRNDLRLTDKQVKKIDQIFEEFIPKQRERWHEIEKLDDQLAKVTKESTADVATVAQQIERLEKLRAEERTARAVMIYQMRLLLNAEQRVKVDAIRARLDEDRRRQEEERKRQGKGDKDRHEHAPRMMQ